MKLNKFCHSPFPISYSLFHIPYFILSISYYLFHIIYFILSISYYLFHILYFTVPISSSLFSITAFSKIHLLVLINTKLHSRTGWTVCSSGFTLLRLSLSRLEESKCSVSKLVNWHMIFWIMFNVIWFREFCGWLSYLEYEQ